MNEELSGLVRISRNQQDEVIDQLVATRKNLNTGLSLDHSSEELGDILRIWYQRAVDHEIILMINLIVLQLGQPDSAQSGRLTWNHQAGSLKIDVTYFTANHTTEVRVNNWPVCANGNAAERLFIPGQWTIAIRNVFRRLEDEKAWRAEIAERAKKEQLILSLTAEI